MTVQVDEPRAGYQAGTVDYAAAFRDAVKFQSSGGDDLSVSKQDVAHPVQLAAGVNDPSVANNYIVRFHTPLPRAECL
jgi:hypothetical protein